MPPSYWQGPFWESVGGALVMNLMWEQDPEALVCRSSFRFGSTWDNECGGSAEMVITGVCRNCGPEQIELCQGCLFNVLQGLADVAPRVFCQERIFAHEIVAMLEASEL